MKTNASKTSIDSYYNHVVPSGKVKDQGLKVSKWFLDQKEPRTIREAGEALGLEQGSVSRACNGLVAARVLVQVGEKKNIHGTNVKALVHSLNLKSQKELFQ